MVVFTARCTLLQSAVLRSHVVCPSVRLSVCLSVTLVDQDHIGRKSWKLIARTLSPTPSLFGAQRSSTKISPCSQGNMGKFWGDQRWGGKNGALEHKSGNISETRTDRGKVTMGSLQELQSINQSIKTFARAPVTDDHWRRTSTVTQ